MSSKGWVSPRCDGPQAGALWRCRCRAPSERTGSRFQPAEKLCRLRVADWQYGVMDVRYGWADGVHGVQPCHILARIGEFYKPLCSARPPHGFPEVTLEPPTADRICEECFRHVTSRQERQRRERQRRARLRREAQPMPQMSPARESVITGYCAMCRDERRLSVHGGGRPWLSCSVCGGYVKHGLS
jgi:hypothetical protein